MKTLNEIQTMLDEKVNTLLGQHRGRVDIVKLDREVKDMDLHIDAAYVKMSGGCQGCAGAKATLRSIVSAYIKEFDPSIKDIFDVTDHTDKTQAFFKE